MFVGADTNRPYMLPKLFLMKAGVPRRQEAHIVGYLDTAAWIPFFYFLFFLRKVFFGTTEG